MSRKNDITHGGYGDKILPNIQRYRKENLFCDVNICVRGATFSAHRVPLASSSGYFERNFSSGESISGRVELNDLNPYAVELVLDFMYTGKITLTVDNVNDVMAAAVLLKIESLLDSLSDYLTEALDPVSALLLRVTSRQFSLTKLDQKIEECIIDNFDIVCTQKKFLELSPEEIRKYLSKDQIVAREDELLVCLLNWTKADMAIRKKHFLSLFRLIRLQRVSVEYLHSVLKKEPLITKSLQSRDLIEEALYFHIRPNGIEEQQVRLGKYNVCMLTKDNCLQNINFGIETTVNKMQQPSMHVSYASAVVNHGGKLYFFGGFPKPNNQRAVQTIISFDGRMWNYEGSLVYRRANATAVAIHGAIFIFGGESKGNDVKQTERFFDGNCVEDYRFKCGFCRVNAASVAIGGFVYLIGGYSKSAFEPVGYGHKPENCRTTKVNVLTGETYHGWSLNYDRGQFGACAVGNKIFVCGGISKAGISVNTIEYLEIVENFNNEGAAWTVVNNKLCDGVTSVCLFGSDQLLILGGKSDDLMSFDCKSLEFEKTMKMENAYSGSKTESKRTCLLKTAKSGSKIFKL